MTRFALTIIAVRWRHLRGDSTPGLGGPVPGYTYRAGDEKNVTPQHSPSVRRVSVWLLPLP